MEYGALQVQRRLKKFSWRHPVLVGASYTTIDLLEAVSPSSKLLIRWLVYANWRSQKDLQLLCCDFLIWGHLDAVLAGAMLALPSLSFVWVWSSHVCCSIFHNTLRDLFVGIELGTIDPRKPPFNTILTNELHRGREVVHLGGSCATHQPPPGY